MRIRKLIAAAAVAGAIATTGLATATSASALTFDCTTGQVCLYYNSEAYGYGAYYAQNSDIDNYGDNGLAFSAGHNGGNGAGIAVKNHAASVDSHWGGEFVIYFNSGYDCSVSCQTFGPYQAADLIPSMKNNNASGRFFGA
ncbi:hypothetical protein [Kitasatospora sp. HPMI-4]|uniref:hypothetical protein n=1 Tax=Kitasatospora sp. HPMI-4 TaxID=3448443 RepID=UPI003F1B9616